MIRKFPQPPLWPRAMEAPESAEASGGSLLACLVPPQIVQIVTIIKYVYLDMLK